MNRAFLPRSRPKGPKWTLWLACACIVWLGLGGAARADLFGLEPGKRIKGHARLDCDKCHTSGSGVARAKCLGCHEHKPLAKRIRMRKGLHAKPKFRKPCETCHAEHKGARFNPINWRPFGGERRFKHDLTGYKLQGAHKRVNCKECHKAKHKKSRRTTYLGLKTDCLSCHDDVHRFTKRHKKLTDCKVCHSFDARTVARAKGLKFDHGAVSKFPLKGRHLATRCTKCHTSTKQFKMKKRPERCADCHKDPHKNVYTTKRRDCKACHADNSKDFKKPRFNHTKNTRFRLKNKHARQKCIKCHAKKEVAPPKMACASCHDSSHVVRGKNRFKGRNCGQCHNDKSFKQIAFDHGARAGFALGGKHGRLKCTECHRSKPKRRAKSARDTFEFFKSSNCVDCHAHKTAHDGAFNDRHQLCVKCHVPGSTNIKTPDHAELSTAFAQQGAHAKVDCARCHGQNLTKLKIGNDCISCHADDDAHDGALGKRCQDCHIEGFPWQQVLFDHNKQSTFELEGRHLVVACARCHTSAPKQYKPTPVRCADCHAQQDIHGGKLGQDCAQCHDASGGAPLFDHNRMTDYTLEGAHARANCLGCHAEGEGAAKKLSPTFAVVGSHCADCHGDPHGLRTGARCAGCHDTESFNHAAGKVGGGDIEAVPGAVPADSAVLGEVDHSGGPAGAGGSEPAAQALDMSGPIEAPPAPHQPGAGSADERATAAPHAPPDVAGIAPVMVAAPLRDAYHDHPPFSLAGAHARLECQRCHGGSGDLQGSGQMCATCHMEDDVHASSLGPQCGRCHNVTAFVPARFSHTQVGFTLAGSHRMLACNRCHAAGAYAGISGACIACHADDAARVRTVDHAGFLSQSCIACHNQVTWTRAPMLRRRSR